MFTATIRWWNISNHSGFWISSERIFQHLSKFTASKWKMLFLEVKSTNALLQCKKWLVNFGTVKLCLLVSVHGISSSFATRQIYERYFSVRFSALRRAMHQLHLKNGMWSWGFSICSSLSRGTALQPTANSCHDVLNIYDLFFSQADYVHSLFVVLPAL